jgi:hypothetical protein
MKNRFMVWWITTLLALVSVPALADGIVEMTRLLKAGDAASAPAPVENTTQKTGAKASVSGDATAIRLTPDRTKILRLRESAASVIVANPAHASVTLDSPRLLILMPRMPGTTSFTVLNAEGKTLLERNIIVSAAQPRYIRVRRICGSASDCAPSNYYYCPDGCFEVTPVAHENGGNIPEVQASAPGRPLFDGDSNPADATEDATDPMILEEIDAPLPAEDDGDTAEENVE